jgi:hypothetical protein
VKEFLVYKCQLILNYAYVGNVTSRTKHSYGSEIWILNQNLRNQGALPIRSLKPLKITNADDEMLVYLVRIPTKLETLFGKNADR